MKQEVRRNKKQETIKQTKIRSEFIYLIVVVTPSNENNSTQEWQQRAEAQLHTLISNIAAITVACCCGPLTFVCSLEVNNFAVCLVVVADVAEVVVVVCKLVKQSSHIRTNRLLRIIRNNSVVL